MEKIAKEKFRGGRTQCLLWILGKFWTYVFFLQARLEICKVIRTQKKKHFVEK